MIHSASFIATGSEIAASTWVASAALCWRMRSMTFCSASVSAWDVDDVAASAAAGGGLRGGGKAACWRVAGASTGAAAAALAAGAIGFRVALAAGALVLPEALAATLRAIGRGRGNGTVGLAQASAATNATARLVARAVDRNAAAREGRVTAFLCGESFKSL